MPHYLRTLVYASEPDDEWGPTKNENRYGRYKPRIDQSIYKYQENITNDDNNTAVENKETFYL